MLLLQVVFILPVLWAAVLLQRVVIVCVPQFIVIAVCHGVLLLPNNIDNSSQSLVQ